MKNQDRKVLLRIQTLIDRGEIDLAEQALQSSEVQLNSSTHLMLRGSIAYRRGQYETALIYSSKAVEGNRNEYALWLLCLTFWKLERHEECRGVAQEIIELNPNHKHAFRALSTALRALGKPQKAVDYQQRLHQHSPDDEEFLRELLMGLIYVEVDPDELMKLGKLKENIELGTSSLRAKYREIRKSKDAKLRLGIISPDARMHSAIYCIFPFLNTIDRSLVDIYFYSTTPENKTDSVTNAVETRCAKFFRLGAKFDVPNVVKMIRNDGLDVIIDTAGHSSYSGLAVLSHRVAPTQISWLGFPGTTGYTNIDWYICSEALIGFETDQFEAIRKTFSEKLIILRSVPWSFRPHTVSPLKRYNPKYFVRDTPALENGYVTFGTCSSVARLNSEVCSTWQKILDRVEGSRLLIEYKWGSDQTLRAFQESLKNMGLDPERIDLVRRNSDNQYLTYHHIDVVLDPFPCNGGVTSMDALWMGLPFVTKVGDSFRGRIGLMLLTAVELAHLAASNKAEYVEVAVKLASDVMSLNRLRKEIRPRLMRSPVMDETGHSNELMNAISHVHRHREHLKQRYVLSRDIPEQIFNHQHDYIVTLPDGSELPGQLANQRVEELIQRVSSSEKLTKDFFDEALILVTSVLESSPTEQSSLYLLCLIDRSIGNKVSALRILIHLIEYYQLTQFRFLSLARHWASQDGQTLLVKYLDEKFRLVNP